MSVGILQKPDKAHSIHDDIESCLWVLYYIAIHYFELESGKSYIDSEIFDESAERFNSDGEQHTRGGNGKNSFLTQNWRNEIKFKSQPLTQAFAEFADVLGQYHLSRELVASTKDEAIRIALQGYFKRISQDIEKVDSIIAIFDRAIESDITPMPAVSDQLRKKTSHESLLLKFQGVQKGFANFDPKDGLRLAPSAGEPESEAKPDVVPTPPVPSSHRTGPSGRGLVSLPVDGVFGGRRTRSATKRAKAIEDEADLGEGTSDGRVKRARTKKAKEGSGAGANNSSKSRKKSKGSDQGKRGGGSRGGKK